MIDWTQVIVALIVASPAIIAAVMGFVNRSKIDANTVLTKHGADEASRSARVAVASADKVEVSTSNIERKLNGGIDDAIRKAVAPVQAVLEAHTDQDAKDLAEVKDKFGKLEQYVHDRNHDILNAIGVVALDQNLIMLKLGVKK